jgi:hypothetical protein
MHDAGVRHESLNPAVSWQTCSALALTLALSCANFSGNRAHILD